MSTRSTAELLLATQLDTEGIPYEREYHFASKEWAKDHGYLTPTGRPKQWRADFRVYDPGPLGQLDGLLVEVDGGGFVAGRHSRGAGIEADAVKQSVAAILGYRVLRVTPRHVNDGTALKWIKQALGLEVGE